MRVYIGDLRDRLKNDNLIIQIKLNARRENLYLPKFKPETPAQLPKLIPKNFL